MRESFRKNKKGILLMLLSSVCVCTGQLLWKLSLEYGLWMMLAGFFFYGIGALVMLVAYRFGKLSVLQPMLSLNYVVSIALGALILSEAVTLQKCVAVLVIVAGVVLIAGSDKE